MFYCGCRNPGHLEKVLLLHAPILSPNEAFLGIGARALVARQTDRQTDRVFQQPWFDSGGIFFFFSFFSNIIALFINRRFFGFSFFFFFLTVLNFLQNSYDDVSIIVKLCKRKDSLDIFR